MEPEGQAGSLEVPQFLRARKIGPGWATPLSVCCLTHTLSPCRSPTRGGETPFAVGKLRLRPRVTCPRMTGGWPSTAPG